MKIIIILNCWYINTSIPAISDSGSDACSVSSNCYFLPFSMPHHFLLKTGHDVLDKRNCGNTFSSMLEMWGEGKCSIVL